MLFSTLFLIWCLCFGLILAPMLTNPRRGVFNKAIEYFSTTPRGWQQWRHLLCSRAAEQMHPGQSPCAPVRLWKGPAVATLGNDQNRYWGHCGGSTWGTKRKQQQLCPPQCLCPELCSATTQHCRVGLGAAAQGIQVPLLSPSCCRDQGAAAPQGHRQFGL